MHFALGTQQETEARESGPFVTLSLNSIAEASPQVNLVVPTVRTHLQCRRPEFDPWVGKILWRRAWQPTPVFLLGESHGQRCLAGYSPWGRKESNTTEQLSLSPQITADMIFFCCHFWLGPFQIPPNWNI